MKRIVLRQNAINVNSVPPGLADYMRAIFVRLF